MDFLLKQQKKRFCLHNPKNLRNFAAKSKVFSRAQGINNPKFPQMGHAASRNDLEPIKQNKKNQMNMKHLFNSLRTLCLMAIACMVSLNALAYTVYSGEGDIFVSGKLLVNQDATVNNCTNKWGTLIIAEGVTLTVTENFEIMFCEIYVFGTLNIQRDEGELLYESTVYVMEGGKFFEVRITLPLHTI